MPESGCSAAVARKKLYESVAVDAPFEEKATRAIEVGERFLSVDNAHLTRIDAESNYWSAIVSTDPPDGRFPAGLVLDFDTSYCRRTVEADGSLAIHSASEQGWEDDPAFKEHGLHCYHGTPIIVGNEPFGTLCYVSEAARSEPFTQTETMFAELTARLLERELERHRLKSKFERFEEASRVLSHDLRNPLNVAQGRLDLEQAERDSENLAIAMRSLDRIEEIITSVLKVAREGRTVTEVSRVSLSAIAERCWESISTPDATLVVDGDVTFRADPDRLRGVFENLFRNAVEHGGSDVTIHVGPLATGDGFYVEDDGPGIPESDRETVFDARYTTGTEGAGLGLAIVESTVEAHGWSIAVTDAGSGGARFEISGVIPV